MSNEIYNFIMSVRTGIKTLLVQENMTLTELAKIISDTKGIKYTVDSLSRKLKNEKMKYNEAEMFVNAIGYNIKFEKI